MDVFRVATATLLADPNVTVAVAYARDGGWSGTVRAVPLTPDDDFRLGGGQFPSGALTFDVPAGGFPDGFRPEAGDRIGYLGREHRVQGRPLADPRGLVWRLNVHPVRG